MLSIFLILPLLTSTLPVQSYTQFHHNRRILHQPFIPLNPHPPSPQPQPQPQQQQPKYPLSSQSPPNNDGPFFSSYPSPPSTITTTPTFPANISSLILPQSSSSSKHISRKLFSIAVAAAVSLLSVSLITAVAAFLLYHRSSTDKKDSKSDSIQLFPPNTATSDGSHNPPPPPSTVLSNGGASPVLGYQKLGSPELHPLPPLPRQNFRHIYQNTRVGSLGEDENDEDEEFFSPRGSSGRKGSPNGTGSSSPVDFRDPPLIPPAPPRERKVPSPSPPYSPPQRNLGETQNSPARVSVKLPPPPPPLPPPRFWESVVMPPRIGNSISGRPVVVTESNKVVLQNPTENLESVEKNEEIPKMRLKPLHWDKVRASSDRAMAWDQLKSSSFQLNEEMIETLFTVNTSNLAPKYHTPRPVFPSMNWVLDPKKSQNIAILFRALNVTIDEVCEALLEGNGDALSPELLESLLKMAPTKEEERKLKEFKDESPFKLGPAEKFLKAILDIPFAFKRVDTMLYIANFDSEVEYLKRFFETLEAACEELRNSRMFMRLLEAVLMTGNRMNVGTNRGDAHAFKLDTLLKLVDVKGTDGKTTLLHFVVQEIVRAEGSRLSGANQNPKPEENQQSAIRDDIEFRKLGLQVVSGLSGELTNVKKAATMDSDVLSSEVAKLSIGITKVGEVVRLNEKLALKESRWKFSNSMNEFLKRAEEDIIKMQAQESVTLSMVKEITEYFHGNSAKEEAHPLRIFMVVRDFLSSLDQVCNEVGKINERTIVSSGRPFPPPVNPSPPVFRVFNVRPQYSSCDDESSTSP